jgi:anti-sigma B factor antagonist
MNYSYVLENGVLTVALEGRLDTDASAKFETDFAEVCKTNVHSALVVDATNLEYIASSGLRVVLKMAKTEKNLFKFS